MANINANIAKKFISYVRHGVDINSEIKQIYNNSLIFIGDESQIYVPAMNTYVGIGNTAYTATINRIAAVEQQIQDLAKTLSTDLVSKIYANYTSDELTIASVGMGAELTENRDKRWALNNDITIKGINDYDPTTGWARKPEAGHYYTAVDANGTSYNITYTTTDEYYHNGRGVAGDNAQPTSGITITPHWGDWDRSVNPVTNQMVEKRKGNYITIDDTLTWSYMTSAYAYTMSFAKKYTASEIDRLYHNLLGDSVSTYEPIALGTAVANVTDIVSALGPDQRAKANYQAANPGKLLAVKSAGDPAEYTYWTVDSTVDYCYATYTGSIETSDKVYHAITAAEIVAILEGGSTSGLGTFIQYTSDYNDLDVTNFPQLYVLDTQYDSTYNMNIADGINTLKEVAYLLDLLSDGSLGTTTYLTYAQVSAAGALTFAPDTTDNTRTAYTYSYTVGDDNKSFIVTFNELQVNVDADGNVTNWNAPKPDDMVAWYTITGNQENLGIQIAYSIAGNKVQIDDLHSHTDLIEKGQTTLRSVKTTNSDFVTFTMLGGTDQWADTDAHQGKSTFASNMSHPNHPEEGKRQDLTTYQVGDVNLQITLNTATTYATSYSADSSALVNTWFKDEFGVEWFGCYTAADMNNIHAAGATYYTLSSTAEQLAAHTYVFSSVAEPVENTKLQQDGLQYYWIPRSGNEAVNAPTENRTFGKYTKAEFQALSASDVLKGLEDLQSNNTKTTCAQYYARVENNGAVSYAPITGDSDYAYVNALSSAHTVFYYLIDAEPVVVHPFVGDNALATTEWTGAFVDAKVGAIADDLEDILDQAKQYTDEKIDELDNNYIYSDFASYWTTYLTNVPAAGVTWGEGANAFTFTQGDIQSVGSYAYKFTYADEYAKYVASAADRTTVLDAQYNAETNPYRLSYVTKSQYAYNVVEVNGIVNAESRELPTDEFSANAEIWGAESNVKGSKHVYEDLTLPSTGSRTDSLFNRIYNWANTHDDNQIFVKDSTVLTYIPIDPTDTNYNNYPNLPGNGLTSVVGGTDGTLYVLVNGEYVAKSSLTDAGKRNFTNYANTADKNWMQLYQKGSSYIELNFKNIANSGLTYDTTSVTIGDYTLTKDGSTKVSVTKAGDPVTDLGKLLCLANTTVKSTKYFTVENNHFSFVQNGNGENAFNLTAHITRIEDAANDNTGFADAYDVQTYVENYFTWVDISATVSASTVQSSDKYHKLVSLAEYNGTDQLYSRTESGTAPNITVSFGAVQAADVVKAFFWKDDDTLCTLEGATLEAVEAAAVSNHGVHAAVETKYVYEQFHQHNEGEGSGKYTPILDNYYIRIEDAKTNPLNLTETQYK